MDTNKHTWWNCKFHNQGRAEGFSVIQVSYEAVSLAHSAAFPGDLSNQYCVHVMTSKCCSKLKWPDPMQSVIILINFNA